MKLAMKGDEDMVDDAVVHTSPVRRRLIIERSDKDD